MALGERFRGTGSSDVAQFLAVHQGCDAGFDVTRDQGPGSGQLKIRCKGCGQSVEYRAAEAAEMAGGPRIENGQTPPDRAEAAAVPPPSPSPVPRARRPVPPQPLRTSRRFGSPTWLPSLLIAAVILGGIGLIVVGILRSDSGAGDDGGATSSGEQSERSQPADPDPQPSEPAPTTAAQAPATSPSLSREVFIDRFAIGVPRGWRRASPGGNVVLTAPGGVAQIRIYSESPARRPGELAEPMADFLDERHPEATISKPRSVTFGGGPGIQLQAVYGGGEEIAAVTSSGGYSFLVTFRRQSDADARIVEEGEASFASFRPR